MWGSKDRARISGAMIVLPWGSTAPVGMKRWMMNVGVRCQPAQKPLQSCIEANLDHEIELP